MKKIMILSMVVSLNFCGTYQPNTLIAAINKNRFAQWLTKKQAPIFAQIAQTPAAQEYQQLAQEAQEVFKIKETLQIRNAPETLIQMIKKTTGFTFSGLYMPGTIFINEKKLDKTTYGAKRFALYHEMAHACYYDQANAFLLSSCVSMPTFVISWFALNKLFQHYNVHAFGTGFIGKLVLSLFPSNIAGSIATNSYLPYCERRADLCAAHAMHCHECINDVVKRRAHWKQAKKTLCKKHGYLTVQELETIAQEYRETNCLCTYHAKQQDQLASS